MGERLKRLSFAGSLFHFWYSGQTHGVAVRNLGDADEIIGGRSEDEKPFDQGAAAMTGLAHDTDVFIQPNGSSIRNAFAGSRRNPDDAWCAYQSQSGGWC